MEGKWLTGGRAVEEVHLCERGQNGRKSGAGKAFSLRCSSGIRGRKGTGKETSPGRASWDER